MFPNIRILQASALELHNKPASTRDPIKLIRHAQEPKKAYKAI